MPSGPSTSEVLDSMLSSRPDVLEHLTAAHAAAVEAVDRRLLDLCETRIAMLLGAPYSADNSLTEQTVAELGAWPTSPEFSDAERACLAFTEHFVIDVASMPDELAEAVVEALGGDGSADFTHALLVVEQRQRLRLMWGRLFEGDQS